MLVVAPEVALRERSHGELGDENRAGGVEALNNFGVGFEVLIFEAACAPGGGIASDGEQIFATPRDAVQRAAMLVGGEFGVGCGSLLEGAIFGVGDDEVQAGIIAA